MRVMSAHSCQGWAGLAAAPAALTGKSEGLGIQQAYIHTDIHTGIQRSCACLPLPVQSSGLGRRKPGKGASSGTRGRWTRLRDFRCFASSFFFFSAVSFFILRVISTRWRVEDPAVLHSDETCLRRYRRPHYGDGRGKHVISVRPGRHSHGEVPSNADTQTHPHTHLPGCASPLQLPLHV